MNFKAESWADEHLCGCDMSDANLSRGVEAHQESWSPRVEDAEY